MKCKSAIVALCAAVAAIGAPHRASAQSDSEWVAGSANYNVGANWSSNPQIPNYLLDQRAVITNGGQATVSNTPLDQPGAVILGRDAGTSGTLIIANAGNLGVVSSGTAVSTGNVTVGGAGVGTLRVQSGGTLELFNGGLLPQNGVLTSGNNPSNTIVLGAASGAAATVNTSGATFGGTTQVFKNTVFTTNGGAITLNATSVYTPMIAGPTQADVAVLNAGAGNVALAGTLKPTFSVTPLAGASWNLLHGNLVSGAFSSIQPSGLGPGQRLAASVAGAAGDQNLRISVEQVLSLVVDRNARTISIANPGVNPLSFDVYAIQSATGQLNRTLWNSLDDQNALGGDWLESTGSSANKLAEAKPTSTGTMTGGSSISLGTAFQPAAAAGPFGTVVPNDLTFTYATAAGEVTGDVTYTGIAGINNLVLQVDPLDGKARIKNTSGYNVSIDGYTITSPHSSLNRAAWTSFDDQNISDWLESTGSNASQLGEAKPTSSTAFNAGSTAINMGNIFTPASDRDLVFEFVLAGQSIPMTGTVVYDSYLSGSADFDGDGDVDGNDFLRWQRGLGATGGAATLANGNANGDGVINGADLAVWRDQFGNVRPSAVAAATAVPEPATAASLALACLGLVAWRRRRPSQSRHCRA